MGNLNKLYTSSLINISSIFCTNGPALYTEKHLKLVKHPAAPNSNLMIATNLDFADFDYNW